MSVKRLLLYIFLVGWLVPFAIAGTVVMTTTTYPGAQVNGIEDITGVALPEVGVYYFDMVAKASGTTQSWNLRVHLQQEGVSGGAWYTIVNSTFTTCNSNCAQMVVPDIYLGGKIRGRFIVDTGSVTVSITARKVTP